MTNGEAVIWLINITADIGKIEHQELWHYEQALTEIREMLETEPQRMRGRWNELKPQAAGYWQCSACGFPSEAFAAAQLYKFCPNCGADMGEQNET